MERAHSHQQTPSHPASRACFFRGQDVRQTPAFFSDYRSGAVQRQAESSPLPEEKEEEQTLQQKPLETTVQRMCAECEKEQQEKAPLQPKLSVGEAGDPYEQEADRVADQVVDHVQASKAPSIQTRLDSARPHITPFVMRQGAGPVAASSRVEQGIQNTRGAGETLTQPVRDSMEQALGADFGGVRIHANSEADSLNRSLNARAFTTGKDIYFKGGEYQPESPAGQKLLAHELTHVVQQAGSAEGAGQASRGRVIQCSRVSTHFGEFEDYQYGDLTDSAGIKIGVEMYMKFHPGTNARADLIGMTQAAEGKFNGTQITQGIYGQHSATGGAGVGSFIDQLEGAPNPLYAATTLRTGGNAASLAGYQTADIRQFTAAERAAQTTATGVTGVNYRGFGQHGFRKVLAGAFVTSPAELYDAPKLAGAGANSEQVFETTALAIAGPQSGTYYGSVEWGWRKDAGGAFTRLPFRVVSQGVPSATFLTAASLWNPSRASFGFATTRATDLLDAGLNRLSAIPNDAQLTPTGRQGAGGGVTYFEVTYGGNTGFVISTAIRPAAIGAETVDLPVPMVHRVSTFMGTTMILHPPLTFPLTLLLPAGTRITATRCMVPTVALPNHYEGEVVDGPYTGTRGYFFVPDLTLEALGTH